MGKGREKKRRPKANKQRQRTREERDLVKEKVMERFERDSDSPFSAVSAERADAERRAKLSPKYLVARAGSDPPPTLGEPGSPVRAPLKPKPHLSSGAIALLEPEPGDAFLTVAPKSISK
jgi:hypothetical protein